MNYLEIGVFVLVCLNLTRASQVTEGNCTCAVFAESDSKEPIIKHGFPLNVSCDDDGTEICLRLCIALAEGAKERAPALICEKLNRHEENLKVSVYASSCETGNWKFTGLKINKGICCHDGKETSCSPLPEK